jgi:hypothetical protein
LRFAEFDKIARILSCRRQIAAVNASQSASEHERSRVNPAMSAQRLMQGAKTG